LTDSIFKAKALIVGGFFSLVVIKLDEPGVEIIALSQVVLVCLIYGRETAEEGGERP